MNDLDLSPDFYIEWSANQDFSSGKIFHIKRNKWGGSISNEVALFFITKARIPAENFFPHQRLDCFITGVKFVSDPERLARNLFDKLRSRGAISEPTWLGWHIVKKGDGTPIGDVFDLS